jgi:hypothetical protein
MESLKTVLMRRDGLTAAEAEAAIQEAREELARRIDDPSEGDPYEICEDMFGLEPDFLMELI